MPLHASCTSLWNSLQVTVYLCIELTIDYHLHKLNTDIQRCSHAMYLHLYKTQSELIRKKSYCQIRNIIFSMLVQWAVWIQVQACDFWSTTSPPSCNGIPVYQGVKGARHIISLCTVAIEDDALNHTRLVGRCCPAYIFNSFTDLRHITHAARNQFNKMCVNIT